MIKFERDFSLKKHNTFGIEARAKYFFSVTYSSILQDIIRSEFLKDKEVLILGGGSNILFVNDFEGVVLHNLIKGIRLTGENEEAVFIEAGSGENWPGFVDFTVEKGWYGLENLSLIPGTVGAAPVQNIGAYGVEQQNCFDHLTAVNLKTGEQRKFTHAECTFGYRHSYFKENPGWFILSVTYKLMKNGKPVLHYAPLKEHFAGKKEIKPEEISEHIKELRRNKLPDPAETGNSGSFFKNPEIASEHYARIKSIYPNVPAYPLDNGKIKIAAGWLIEQCGWKGKRMKDAGVYHKQALVLVNHGSATGNDILQLAGEIKQSVLEKFGIELEPEVRVVM